MLRPSNNIFGVLITEIVRQIPPSSSSETDCKLILRRVFQNILSNARTKICYKLKTNTPQFQVVTNYLNFPTTSHVYV